MAPRRPSHPGWTLVIVPPNPGARSRTIRVRRWHLRTVAATVGLFLATTAVLGAGAFEFTITADELAGAQQMVIALTDSLRSIERPAMLTGAPIPGAAAVTKARTTASRPLAPLPGVVLPVDGRITSRFSRSRLHPLLSIFRPHLGVDVAAPAGTKIVAPAGGRVSYVGRKVGDGLMVEIDHGDSVVTRYAHCKSILVSVGDSVGVGGVIATVGSSGLATGAHVHFEVLVRGKPVDPLRYLITPREAGAPPETKAAPSGGEER